MHNENLLACYEPQDKLTRDINRMDEPLWMKDGCLHDLKITVLAPKFSRLNYAYSLKENSMLTCMTRVSLHSATEIFRLNFRQD